MLTPEQIAMRITEFVACDPVRSGNDVTLYSVFAFETFLVERIMSSINTTTSAPVNIDGHSEAVTYLRQQNCEHAMARGACDAIERCMKCGLSRAEFEVRPKR